MKKARPSYTISQKDQTAISCAAFTIIRSADGSLRAYQTDSMAEETWIDYQIGGLPVEQVYLPRDLNIVVFHTTAGIRVVDYDNEALDEPQWDDYYLEPYTSQFYRKLRPDKWYDIQGVLLHPPIFISGDVLIALQQKASKKSLSFADQVLRTNPDHSLIQVGKIVFTADLDILSYHGEKITAIGTTQIKLSDRILQEVEIGKFKKGMISLHDFEPYSIHNQMVSGHLRTKQIGQHAYHEFAADDQAYIINAQNGKLLEINGLPVQLQFSEYILYEDYQLINAQLGDQDIVYDLNHQNRFTLSPIIAEEISQLDPDIISIGADRLVNVTAGHRSYVYSLVHHQLFSLHDGAIRPQKVVPLSHYSEYYACAYINDQPQLYYIHTLQLIHIDDQEYSIKSIEESKPKKLINAINSFDEAIVLDARTDYLSIDVAQVDGYQIAEVYGEPVQLGTAILQNAEINVTGGRQRRVLRLDTENLELFCLDSELKAFPEGDQASVFSGNPVIEIYFDQPVMLADEVYFPLYIIPYHEEPTRAYIHRKTKKILRIEAQSNRYELVTHIPDNSNPHHIGDYQLSTVKTLTEDFQEQNLMICQQSLRAWLPVFDDYLPPLESIVEASAEGYWNYQLFKIRSNHQDKQYIAAERLSPFRILVEEKNNKIVPKLISSHKQLIRVPKRRSSLAKIIIGDPGYLK